MEACDKLHYTPGDGKIYLVERLKLILKSKYFWMAAYTVFLLSSVLYVNALLRTSTLDVIEEPAEKKVAEIKPVTVKLVVQYNGSDKEYQLKMNSTDTVLDFLNDLRKDGSFIYDKTAYLDRMEIDQVNGVTPLVGYKWKIFLSDKDVTQEFQDVFLTDGAVYYLKLIKN
jgi:hypothetical protein